MTSQLLSKTYRISQKSIEAINTFAGEKGLNQSKAIDELITLGQLYLRERALDEELEELARDDKWMAANTAWAEMNLN